MTYEEALEEQQDEQELKARFRALKAESEMLLERTDPSRRQQWHWGRDEPADPRPGWKTATDEPFITEIPLVSCDAQDEWNAWHEEQRRRTEAVSEFTKLLRRDEARTRAAQQATDAAARVLDPDDVLKALRGLLKAIDHVGDLLDEVHRKLTASDDQLRELLLAEVGSLRAEVNVLRAADKVIELKRVN
jgi:hypothetical protein